MKTEKGKMNDSMAGDKDNIKEEIYNMKEEKDQKEKEKENMKEEKDTKKKEEFIKDVKGKHVGREKRERHNEGENDKMTGTK